MIRVLFVCLGNICRSPMAEAVFQHQVNEAGLGDQFEIDSAGTGGWHVGEPAHRGTLDVLKRHEVPYHGRARQVASADFTTFDYILAMDRSNLADLKRMHPGANVSLFLSFAQQAGLTQETEVPDPYYDHRFDAVYALVDAGCRALLDHIRRQHHI